jgi:hypothetical protein
MRQSILSMPRGSKELAEGDEPFAEAEVVLAGFLRIVTNAKNLRSADSNESRFAFCQQLVECPRAALVAPSRRHWDLFVGLCTDIQARW